VRTRATSDKSSARLTPRALFIVLLICASGLLGCRKLQPDGPVRVANPDAAVPDAGGFIATSCDQITCNDPAQCQVDNDQASCACPAGYVTDPDHPNGCTDVDECADKSANDCDPNADCKNRTGSFECDCKEGFSGNGKVCTQLSDCAGAANSCHADAQCSVADNGVTCTCSAGFEGDGHVCRDIDECEQGTAQCADHAHCENLRGNYDCLCDTLYAGDGRVSCHDECDSAKADASLCDPHGNARCSFTKDGTASCGSCLQGFVGDGRTCSASDECAALGCGDNSVCDGTAGQRRCACAPGFEGDPKQGCTDIDECAGGQADCDESTSTCLNVPGGYVCDCQAGFERQNGACVNVDECARGLDLCDSSAICTDHTPGYICQCKSGYDGDGLTCADIDECANKTANCANDGLASCQNSRGSYSCVCPQGYTGDATTEGCYCDLSGYWASRQDAQLTSKAQAIGDTVVIAASDNHATIWELNKYAYDGTTLHVETEECGTDVLPEIYSPLYSEVYASAIPDSVYAMIGLQPAGDLSFPKSTALPGMSFVTPSQASVAGIKLNDPLNDPWPASYTDVPDSAWVDTDSDTEPGISLWPGQTTQLSEDGKDTYSYPPVSLKPNSTLIDTRVGCVSVALRSVAHLDGRVEACGRLTGKVISEKNEGRVHSCSVLRMADWDTVDVTCTAKDWANARRCTPDEIKFLDDQDQTSQGSATFEMVKIADANATGIDCDAVRKALPAIVRQ
jgi:hypothetical protein